MIGITKIIERINPTIIASGIMIAALNAIFNRKAKHPINNTMTALKMINVRVFPLLANSIMNIHLSFIFRMEVDYSIIYNLNPR